MVRKTNEFASLVYEECAKVPRGKVVTYSFIAKAIGRPKAVRAVGNALNKNRSPLVPCHRVIRSDGTVGGFVYGSIKKVEILRKEGIEIVNGKINFRKS